MAPTVTHEIVGDGWPHDIHGNAYLNNYGTGSAKCKCGWVSLPMTDARGRREMFGRHIDSRFARKDGV